MRQTMAALAELFISRDRRDYESRSRDRERGDAELERLRARDRLEATLAGLAELDYLKQRQELLVRNALRYQENGSMSGEEDNQPSSAGEENDLNHEEKLLEENILLLRKQLNCLRRRDAGLISQLQELDRQISDLRLDTETLHDHLESDSRPSSGFYELSDGTSGSLSNSSNSVFSECLSSCRSTSCLCAPLDTSLCASEGRLKAADELGVCVECEKQCEDLSSRPVCQSLSAPYSPSPDGTCDSLSKYHCDLIAKNGNDVYRYPSPLHAVAVQSPIFFQSIATHLNEDLGISRSEETHGEHKKPKQSLVTQNASWSTSQALNKRLDSYIFGLLQRRAQPVRSNKPRTSINTDPSKSVLRQGSLCVRPSAGGQTQPWTPELNPNWQTCLSAVAAAPVIDPSKVSPHRQWSVENKEEYLENGVVYSQDHLMNGYVIKNDINTNSLLNKGSWANKCKPLSVAVKEFQELGSPNAVSSPKFKKHLYYPTIENSKSGQTVKASTLKRNPKIQDPVACSDKQEQTELLRIGYSSYSQDEGGHMVSTQYISAQEQSVKHRKGASKNVKVVKVKHGSSSKHRTHSAEFVSETGRDKHRTGSRRSRPVKDVSHSHKASKRTSCKSKRIPASIPEGRILEKQTTTITKSTSQRHHGHHHRHHEAVLAKPKYKRNDYRRRLRGIPELHYEEAFRKVHCRYKREMLGQMSAMYLSSNTQVTSPYAYVGSDSEYSAECASVFHSTILDTSEDECSNYTTNCFGDSESSASEADFVAESSTSSDSEGSSGVNWPQFSQTSHDMSLAQAKAFVKIKASHNLKKRILRFRSGSLKLMTTV